MDQDKFQNVKTPIKCRNGPIYVRHYTDWACCVIYFMLLIAVITLTAIGENSIRMSDYEIKQVLSNSPYGSPVLAIIKTYQPIILSLGLVASLSLITIIAVTTVPFIVVYIFLPISIAAMGLGGLFFLLRYFGVVLPIMNEQFQQKIVESRKIVILAAGVSLLSGFVLSIIIIFCRTAKYRDIMPVLQIGKTAFWPNCCIFLTSIKFILVSVLTIALSMFLMGLSQTKMHNLVNPNITLGIILVWMFWTHGIIESTFDFFTESITIYWYFKQRREENNEHNFCDTLTLTSKLEIKHFGTALFGFVIAYIPQMLNTALEKSDSRFYKTFCFLYRCMCSNLSKYSYIQTILQSHSFCRANSEMHGLKLRTKEMLPNLYMMGNYFVALAKTSMVCLGMTAAFLTIEETEKQVLANPLNVIGPMIIVFFGSQEVSNCIMNWSGVMGDTLVFMYVADVEMEQQVSGSMEPHSCPRKVCQIIKKFTSPKNNVINVHQQI